MLIRVKVHPGSKKEEIKSIGELEYEVWLREKAINGKANLALIKVLSKKFGVKQSEIKIKNPNSRVKLVEVNNEIL